MHRVKDWLERLSSGSLGFAMDEHMRGQHRFVGGAGPAGVQPFSFSITWGAANLVRFLDPFSERFMVSDLTGVIEVGGLVERAACSGTLQLRYFHDATIRYTIDFTGPDQTAYRYVGQKRDLRPWNLHRTHTTCYGSITELASGRVISESVVHFELASLPALAASLRLA